MYHLIDVAAATCVAQTTSRMETLIEWMRIVNGINRYNIDRHRHNGIDFKNLNLTGKDTYVEWRCIGHSFDPYYNTFIPNYAYIKELRSHQVLDDFGRPVDIRLWENEIRRIQSGDIPYKNHSLSFRYPVFRREPALTGARPHGHRIHLPKMMVQFAGQQDAAAHDDFNELYELGLTDHMIQHAMPRNRHDIVDATISLDFKMNTRYGKKDWKKHTKNAAQWGKHKSGIKKLKRKWRKKCIPLDVDTMNAQLEEQRRAKNGFVNPDLYFEIEPYFDDMF